MTLASLTLRHSSIYGARNFIKGNNIVRDGPTLSSLAMWHDVAPPRGALPSSTKLIVLV